jgi:6-phosphogluconolactonase
MNSSIQIYSDLEEVSRVAASLILNAAAVSIQQRGKFLIALSGGVTSRRTYEQLASTEVRAAVDWGKFHVFWGDERFVPPIDPRSNQRVARAALLDHVPIPSGQIYPIPHFPDATTAASVYENVLKKYFSAPETGFDLAILGLGADAHTASLFPMNQVLRETERWVCPVQVTGQNVQRITLTSSMLNRSHQILFLVCGSEKANALQHIFHGPENPMLYPAQLIRPAEGQIQWMVDKEAASLVVNSP